MTQRSQQEKCPIEHYSCNTLPCNEIGALSYSAARMGGADERFGDKLREWRQRRKLSQQALGEKIGADGPRIHRLEKGTENPTLDTLDRLAAALAIDVGELLRPRLEQESGRVEGGSEGSPILAALLARLDADAPAEDSWRGDVLKAIAALNRALRREAAPGEALGAAPKAGR